MKIAPHSETCYSFIGTQLGPRTPHDLPPVKLRPAITISRQTGSGARAIAGQLAGFLQSRDPAKHPWTVFDKSLVEKVLEEHKLPKEIAKFMPEDHVSTIQDAIEEILGLHPSARTLWQKTAETVQHLAELGHVILVGRAANIITREMKNVFHVRLIAPLDQRVQQVMARSQLDAEAVLAHIRKEDLGRQRYLKDHFQAEIDDNLRYDLVLNTARIPHPAAARLIGEAVLQWADTL